MIQDWGSPGCDSEVPEISGIKSVAISSIVPGQSPTITAFYPQGSTETQPRLMVLVNADHDFIPTLGMEIIKGRNFSKEFIADPENSIIINETAAKKLGWQNPIGKTIKSGHNMTSRRIIGVIRDFHLTSLHKKIAPVFICNSKENLNSFSINISHWKY